MTDPSETNLNDLPQAEQIAKVAEIISWSCPNDCPYQADDHLAFRAWQEMRRSSSRLFLPLICLTAIFVIWYSQYYEDRKKPDLTFIGLSFMVLVTSFHRQDVIIDSSASVIDAAAKVVAQVVGTRK